MKDLFVREARNPLLTAEDVPFAANSIFNPGVAEYDGHVVLLCRVERRPGISELVVARSADGIGGWTFDDRPLLAAGDPSYPFERWGCEDPRLTWSQDLGQWVICYTAYSEYGPALAIARTSDFVSVERLGIVMPPNNKDAVLFPRRIGGLWRLLHRCSRLYLAQ